MLRDLKDLREGAQERLGLRAGELQDGSHVPLCLLQGLDHNSAGNLRALWF